MSFGAMAMAVCTPVVIILPPSSLHSHRKPALSTKLLRVRRTSHHQPLHHKTVNARHTKGDYHGDHERAPCDCSKREEPEHHHQHHHVKEDSAKPGKSTPPTWEGFHYFSRVGFCKAAREKQQDLQERGSTSAQQLRCKVRRWWQIATRPQNLLAAFLAGLLLYAIALFGWQVMVVAVDVTLFVLKCSFAATLLLCMYIFLI